jgi:4-hydroxy-3-methylbut-2-en-1-yl diphosphate synthase IspG/GcpE
MALSKNLVIYHRGERRVFRQFQSLLVFSGAFAVSMCSAVKFKDIAISMKNSTVPFGLWEWA